MLGYADIGKNQEIPRLRIEGKKTPEILIVLLSLYNNTTNRYIYYGNSHKKELQIYFLDQKTSDKYVTSIIITIFN